MTGYIIVGVVYGIEKDPDTIFTDKQSAINVFRAYVDSLIKRDKDSPADKNTDTEFVNYNEVTSLRILELPIV